MWLIFLMHLLKDEEKCTTPQNTSIHRSCIWFGVGADNLNYPCQQKLIAEIIFSGHVRVAYAACTNGRTCFLLNELNGKVLLWWTYGIMMHCGQNNPEEAVWWLDNILLENTVQSIMQKKFLNTTSVILFIVTNFYDSSDTAKQFTWN